MIIIGHSFCFLCIGSRCLRPLGRKRGARELVSLNRHHQTPGFRILAWSPYYYYYFLSESLLFCRWVFFPLIFRVVDPLTTFKIPTCCIRKVSRKFFNKGSTERERGLTFSDETSLSVKLDFASGLSWRGENWHFKYF